MIAAVHPQTAGQSTHWHVRDGAAAIHLSCVVTRTMAQPRHLKAEVGGASGLGAGGWRGLHFFKGWVYFYVNLNKN